MAAIDSLQIGDVVSLENAVYPLMTVERIEGDEVYTVLSDNSIHKFIRNELIKNYKVVDKKQG